ncbi:hypothetical protein [Nocardia sp. NPDC051570]|uniref:hypothetical protein n=1 Tax=Nocardia sp. NPDC051570 TaxID=3364324 RepID=UPI0037A26F7D
MVTEKIPTERGAESLGGTTCDLSASVYDIAAVSLVPGPQQDSCVQWLVHHRATDAAWGPPVTVNWYDAYLSTYSAAVAMRNAGRLELADRAVAALPAWFPLCRAV